MPEWSGPAVVLSLGVVSLVLGREMLRTHRLLSALRADQMELALRRPRPSWLGRDRATYCQAVAALLTGDAPRAERLLDEIPDRPAARSSIDPMDVRHLRAELLVEAGHHQRAARLLGDDPVGGQPRRLRAATAIECGDYDLANALLQPSGESGYEEAMRLRVAGLLAGRRGDRVESSSYLNESLALLAGLDTRDYPGLEVDRAWTHHYLAEGALLAGDLHVAVVGAEQAATLMDHHGRHPQGIFMGHSLAARANARSRHLDAARRHLDEARGTAGRLHGDAFRAELLTAEAEVAWAEGRAEDARASLKAARAIRDALGESPARDHADALLAEWTAT